MSAFIVADNTINNIVNWLWRDEDLDRFSRIPDKLKAQGFDTSVAGWIERLGHALFQLNVIAVAARYGNGEATKCRPLAYRYEVAEPVPLVQILKSLHCWLYQCNEGDVPETGLYGLFNDDVQLYLMDKIITKLPEYQQAEWG